jgi:hypothetical protein
MNRVSLLAAGGIGALLIGTPAFATITIFSSPPFPPNPPENVLLNTGTTGLTVVGTTNQTGTLVNFTGTETLTEPANGQARIEAVDGGFNSLMIALANPNLGFGAIEFNLDAAANGTANLTFTDQFGTAFSGSFAISQNGQNFFNAVASGGEVIKNVSISTTVNLADVQQVRLGSVLSAVIPEPGTWAMMILGMGGLGTALRSRRRNLSAAPAST